MPGRKFVQGNSKYRYGFNGKENDKDISEGGQDYGMRISDARLGRFLSVDPITDEYPELTPYQFASNRPIDGIDLDGLEWVEGRLAWENGTTKFRLISSEKVSPIGITYDHLTVNVSYKGQTYRFSTEDPRDFWSSGTGYGNNSFKDKFSKFVTNPDENIANGNVVSLAQGLGEIVRDYAATEMIIPSSRRVAGGKSTSQGKKLESSKPTTPTAATNKQVTAANNKNTNAATSNTASNAQAQGSAGEYKQTGGHHVHAKAAFKSNLSYDENKGFSISQSYMNQKRMEPSSNDK